MSPEITQQLTSFSTKVYQILRMNSRFNFQQRYAGNQKLISRGDKDLTFELFALVL